MSYDQYKGQKQGDFSYDEKQTGYEKGRQDQLPKDKGGQPHIPGKQQR